MLHNALHTRVAYLPTSVGVGWGPGWGVNVRLMDNKSWESHAKFLGPRIPRYVAKTMSGLRRFPGVETKDFYCGWHTDC